MADNAEKSSETAAPEDLKAQIQQRIADFQALKAEKARIDAEKMRLEVEKAKAELEQKRQTTKPTDAPEAAVRTQPVRKARWRPRHLAAALLFILLVPLPALVADWYLRNVAEDRYVSVTGFSIRSEDMGSAFELLAGIGNMSSSSSSDADVLYDYIQSPTLGGLCIPGHADSKAFQTREACTCQIIHTQCSRDSGF